MSKKCYCGECCWFCNELTDGEGECFKKDLLADSMNCSDECDNGAFVSRERRDKYLEELAEIPSGAAVFAADYIKTMSERL